MIDWQSYQFGDPATIPVTCGVYCLCNLQTRECYVGRSTNIEQRCRTHKRLLLSKEHENPLLQKAADEFGINSFEVILLEQCNTKMESLRSEQRWIKFLQPALNYSYAGTSCPQPRTPDLPLIPGNWYKVESFKADVKPMLLTGFHWNGCLNELETHWQTVGGKDICILPKSISGISQSCPLQLPLEERTLDPLIPVKIRQEG